MHVAIFLKVTSLVWRVFKVLCFATGCLVLALIAFSFCQHTFLAKWPAEFEALAPASEVEVLDSYVDDFEKQYIVRIRNADVRARMIEGMLRRNPNARTDRYGVSNPDMRLRCRFMEEHGEGDSYVFQLYGECPYGRYHHGSNEMIVVEGRDGAFFVSMFYY